jgi:hypothetical protein
MSKHEEIVGTPISDAIGGEMAEEKEVPKTLSRKDFVKGAAVVAGAGALASCAPAATPAPEAAPTCPPAEECPPCPTPAAAAEAVEAVYDVYPPYGVPTAEMVQPGPRLDTLDGKTICGVYHGAFHFDETWPVMKELLSEKYPTAKFVGWEEFADSDLEDPEELAALIEQYQCDAFIVGNGC